MRAGRESRRFQHAGNPGFGGLPEAAEVKLIMGAMGGKEFCKGPDAQPVG
jgi:hypothetical protein